MFPMNPRPLVLGAEGDDVGARAHLALPAWAIPSAHFALQSVQSAVLATALGAPPRSPSTLPAVLAPSAARRPRPKDEAGWRLPPRFPPHLAERALGVYSLLRTLSRPMHLQPFSAYAFLQVRCGRARVVRARGEWGGGLP